MHQAADFDSEEAEFSHPTPPHYHPSSGLNFFLLNSNSFISSASFSNIQCSNYLSFVWLGPLPNPKKTHYQEPRCLEADPSLSQPPKLARMSDPYRPAYYEGAYASQDQHAGGYDQVNMRLPTSPRLLPSRSSLKSAKDVPWLTSSAPCATSASALPVPLPTLPPLLSSATSRLLLPSNLFHPQQSLNIHPFPPPPSSPSLPLGAFSRLQPLAIKLLQPR